MKNLTRTKHLIADLQDFVSSFKEFFEGKIPKIFILLGSCGKSFLDLPEVKIIKKASIQEKSLKSINEFYHENCALVEFEGVLIFVSKEKKHLYEGFSMEEITFLPRAMALLGVEFLFTTSCVHLLSEELEDESKVFLVKDHINNSNTSPFEKIVAKQLNSKYFLPNQIYLTLGNEQTVVYRYVYDFSFGTESERELWYKQIDNNQVIGSSVVPESLAAFHMGMKIIAIVMTINAKVKNLKNGEKKVLKTLKEAIKMVKEVLFSEIKN